MTADIRDWVAEVLAGVPLHELTKPERDSFLRDAAKLIEAFPLLAQPVEWEYKAVSNSERVCTRGTLQQVEDFRRDFPDALIYRQECRRAGEWEVVE